jgi:hypothetical protein
MKATFPLFFEDQEAMECWLLDWYAFHPTSKLKGFPLKQHWSKGRPWDVKGGGYVVTSSRRFKYEGKHEIGIGAL